MKCCSYLRHKTAQNRAVLNEREILVLNESTISWLLYRTRAAIFLADVKVTKDTDFRSNVSRLVLTGAKHGSRIKTFVKNGYFLCKFHKFNIVNYDPPPPPLSTFYVSLSLHQ